MDRKKIDKKEEGFELWIWLRRGRKSKRRKQHRIEGLLRLYLVWHLAGLKHEEWIWRQRRQMACCCCKSYPEEQIEEEVEEVEGEGNNEKQLE